MTTTEAPIPLTTTFTPPSECLSDLWAVSSGRGTWMNLGPLNTTLCLPSGYSPSTYYSPGICPSGYVKAATVEYRTAGTTETAATCCPVGAGGNTYSIRDSATVTEAWWGTEPCAWQVPTNVVTEYTYSRTVSGGSTTSTSGYMSYPGSLNAYGVVIRYQSTDNITPATATASNVEGTTTAASASSTDSQASTGSSSGLSSGAKAGVGVGVAVGGALIIAIAVAWYFLRRKRQQPQPVGMQDFSGGPAGNGYQNTAYHDNTYQWQQPAEMPTTRNNAFAYQKAELSSLNGDERPAAPAATPAELAGH